MLLIAEPKSASTSLMWSIAEILNIQKKNGQSIMKGEKRCKGYEELQKYHNTTVQRRYSFMKHYIESKDVIYKEHILPTKEHIKYIEDINKPVVVLLRDSEPIIESYKRVFTVFPEIQKKIDFEKLKEELDLFNKIYSEIDNKIYLKITFEDVVLNFVSTMKKILSHYGFKKTITEIKKYELAKRNYTGHGIRKLKDDSI